MTDTTEYRETYTSKLKKWLFGKPTGFQFMKANVVTEVGVPEGAFHASIAPFLNGGYVEKEVVGYGLNSRPTYRYKLAKDIAGMIVKERRPVHVGVRKGSEGRTESYTYTLIKALAPKPVGFQFSSEEASRMSGLERQYVTANLKTAIEKGYIVKRTIGKMTEFPYGAIFDYRIVQDLAPHLAKIHRGAIFPRKKPVPVSAPVSQTAQAELYAPVVRVTGKLPSLTEVSDQLVDLAAAVATMAKITSKSLKDFSVKELLAEVSRRTGDQ